MVKVSLECGAGKVSREAPAGYSAVLACSGCPAITVVFAMPVGIIFIVFGWSPSLKDHSDFLSLG